MTEPLPPNTLILPIASTVSDTIMDNPSLAGRYVRRSVWFITPADHVTILSVTRSDGPTPLLDLLTIEFSVITPGGRAVYCSPIDFTATQPAPSPIYDPDPRPDPILTAGGQTPLTERSD